MKKLTIIIPLYNERKNILPVYNVIKEELQDASFSYEVLFVDDGSTDNPKEIFEASGLKYISHPENRGYGSAIKSGVLAADSEYICIIDCDRTYHPRDIRKLMEYTEDYPMVVGARDVRVNPWLHKISKRVVCFLLSSLFNQKIADVNSGLRIIRRDTFLKFLPGLSDRFSLTTSITYGFLLMNFPIKYVPIEYNKRVGQSKVRSFSFTMNFIQSLKKMRRFCLEEKDKCNKASNEQIPFNSERTNSSELSSKEKKKEWLIIISVFILGILTTTIFLWGQLIDQYNIEYDVCQHSYWMVKYHNPELFQDDIYVKYAQYLAPPGYQFLYYIITYLMNPIFAGKLISIFLFGLTGVFCYLIGRFYWSRLLGLLIVFFFIGYPQFLNRYIGGLQRSFMFPFLFMFIYILSSGKHKFLGWLMGLQVLFYPVSAVISISILIINSIFNPPVIKEYFQGRWTKIGYVFLIAAISMLIAQKTLQKPDFLGPRVTKSEMFSDPVFYKGGRSNYLPFTPFYEFIKENLLGKSGSNRILALFFPFFFLFSWIKGKSTRHIWLPILSVFLSSIALFELAKLFLFKLYIPDRYLEYTFDILSVVFVSLAVLAILMLIKNHKTRKTILVLLLIFSLIYNSGNIIRFFKRKVKTYPKDIPMLVFISTLPKNSLIAADPYISDDISVFSKRKVLLKYELSHPWFKNYRKIVEDRAEAFYKAYFTESLLDLKEFAEKNGVNYIICEKKIFTKLGWEEKKLIYQPLNNSLKLKYPFSSEKQYLLPRMDKSLRCYEDAMYIVIRCDPTSIEKAL